MPTHAIPSTGIAASELASGLSRLGFTSCLDVVRQGRQAFLEHARTIDTPADAATPTDADALYDAALSRASSLAQWHNRLIARQSPTTRALRKLDAGDARQRTVATIGDGTQYDDWFARAGNYAATDSVASLFSPASYLVDLYRQARKLHPATSVFHINKRRPDLATFVLSQANMDDEVPNLTLVNEILATAVDAKWNLKEEKSPPFELPYDADADLIDEWIDASDTSPLEILTAIRDHTASVFERSNGHVNQPLDSGQADVERASFRWAPYRYIAHDQGTRSWRDPLPTEVSTLARQAGLSVPQVYDLLAVEPAYGADGTKTTPATYGATTIHSADRSLSPMAVTHEVIGDAGTIVGGTVPRYALMTWVLDLQRSLSISFEELDWIAQQTTLTHGGTCNYVFASFARLRKSHGLSPNAFAGLIGHLNSYSHSGQKSFLCTVYPAEILKLLGSKQSFSSSNEIKKGGAVALICEALQMTPTELEHCVRGAYKTPEDIEITLALLSSLYRVTMIPRLAGVSIGDAFKLWPLIGIDETNVFYSLFSPRENALAHRVLGIIHCTTTIFRWLDNQGMTIDELLRRIATEHPDRADENVLKFVTNLHQTVDTEENAPQATPNFRTDDKLFSLISRHFASHCGMKSEATAAMLHWVDDVIDVADPALKDYNLAAFWADVHAAHKTKSPLRRDDLPEKMVRYVFLVSQFAEVCLRYGIEEQDIAQIIAPESGHPALNESDSTPSLTLSSLFHIACYASWRDQLKGSADDARRLLANGKRGDIVDFDAFALANGWPADDASDIYVNTLNSKLSSFSSIRMIEARLRFCQKMHVNHRQLRSLEKLFSSTSSVITPIPFLDRSNQGAIARAALALASPAVRHRVENHCAERLRDARLSCYIKLNDWGNLAGRINTPEDLYEYLLLDPLVTAKPTTSRLAEAIASVQLYMHRCREGMEPDVIASALAELKRPGGYFADWNAYHKRYGTWAGLQRLLRYPASFLDPTLRYTKTEPFKQLEQTLSSARLTGPHVKRAFEQFVGSTAERLAIRIDAAFETEPPLGGSIYLLGHDDRASRTYYWRRIDTPVSSAQWTDWEKINCPVPAREAGTPRIFFFESQLRVAWWESREVVQSEGNPSRFDISLTIGSLMPGGQWTTHTYDILKSWRESYFSASIVVPASKGNILARLYWNGPLTTDLIYADMTRKPADEWPFDYNFTLIQKDTPDHISVRQTLRYRVLGANANEEIDTETHPQETSNWHDDFPHNIIVTTGSGEGSGPRLFKSNGHGLLLLGIPSLPGYCHRALHSGLDTFLGYATQKSMPASKEIWNAGPGMYLWEMFLHGPMLVASRLIDEQQFDEATTWLERLFSPSGYVDEKGAPLLDAASKPLHWNTLPLQDDVTWNSPGQVNTDDPDIIAMLDPMHYKLAIFQRWLKLYLDRGDRAYRQQTRDTLTEAKMWYVQASQLLGEQPYFHEVPGSLWPNPSLAKAATSTLGALDVLDGMVEPDKELPAGPGPRGQIDLIDGVFLSPLDDDTLQWWPRIAMRLRYLRAGLSLDGRPLVLPLYETPVSPRELQQRRLAAGANGGDLGGPVSTMPVYRFLYALERARSIVREVMQFGMTLQSLMERKDGDALGALREDQAVAIQALVKDDYLDRQRQMETTERGLKQSRSRAEQRRDHYQSLFDRNLLLEETAAQVIRYALPPLYHLTASAGAAAAFLDTVPNSYTAGMSFGVGGIKWSAVGNAVVQGMQLEAAGMESIAAGLEQKGAYAVRRDEWNTQKTLAEAEIEQIDIQLEINASEQRQAIEASELLALQYEHAKATRDLLATRFSSQELFGWQASRASTLYYQLYDMALGLCGEAQSAYTYETGQPASFILPGVWDDLHQGLLAGEGLLLGLQRMEQAFQQQNIRPLEVERTVSLAALADQPLADLIAEVMGEDPSERMSLRASGALTVEYAAQGLDISFKLNDAGIAKDYPASMNLGTVRRIKSMALTLPALLGPYEDIRALLSYGGTYASGMPRGCQAVAISRGLADSGQFVLDFSDARYLPFEGIPVDDPGEIRLSFPDPVERPQREMLLSITDAILHVRYTIQEAATA